MTILALMLAAQGGPRLSLASGAFISAVNIGGTATATYKLTSAGDIMHSLNGGADSDQGDWITPKSAAGSNYEGLITMTSGTLSGGAGAGSWLDLGTTREWWLQRGGGADATVTATVEIRRVGTTTILASATVTWEVTT